MRIDQIKISNYKGIRNVEVSGLSDQAVIVISGKNGTGKSLILEAILATWTGERLEGDDCIGPWGDDANVSVRVKLTEAERETMRAWAGGTTGYVGDIAEVTTASRRWNRRQGPQSGYSASPLSILRDARFSREHGFTTIDLIPANRSASTHSQSSLSIDLGILGEERLQLERKASIESALRWRNPYTVGDVLSYLATIDYMDQIGPRSGLGATEDFDLLTRNFLAATGKGIEKPKIDVNSGVSISISTPHSGVHPISALSIGEHEVLNLMYFARRLNARGGVLLIDEPEQHLHPTLQVALFETMANMAERAQVIAVSHSPSLIASVPPISILEMSPPTDETSSQLASVSENTAHVSLLHELGLRPSALVQADALIVVEGNDDEAVLRSLFPIELSRCRFMVAGDVDQVMNACKTLEGVNQFLPWLCVRDRDLLTSHELLELESQHHSLHIWRLRMIENELLDFELISATFSRAGVSKSTEEIRSMLKSFADAAQEEIAVQLIKNELSKVRPEAPTPGIGRLEKLRASYEASAAAFAERSVRFESVREQVHESLKARWEEDWMTLSHGKDLMAKLARNSPYGSKDDLATALASAFAQDAHRPANLESFGLRIANLLHKDNAGSVDVHQE